MTTTSHFVRNAIHPERFTGVSDNRSPLARRGDYPTQKAGFWHTVLDWLVPWGYEDEAGFHCGRETDQTSATGWL